MTLSRHWQYAYTDGNVPTFTADADGDYTLQLSAKLAFPDRAYPASDTATTELKLKADPGMGGAKGCSTTAAGSSLMGLALAALAVIRRRRS